MIKKCQKCGNEFKGKKNQIFCSKKCAHKKVEQIVDRWLEDISIITENVVQGKTRTF